MLPPLLHPLQLNRRLLALAAARLSLLHRQSQSHPQAAAGMATMAGVNSSSISGGGRPRPRCVVAASAIEAAGAGTRRGFATSAGGGMNRAQELFYKQLGFKTIVRDRLKAAREQIQQGLGEGGEGYVVLRDFLRDAEAEKEEEQGGRPDRLCRNMRAEALALFKAGLFYASFAYRGEERVDKVNVHNYELEGFEWDYAPSLLMYTREMMLHVPPLLNELFPGQLRISPRAYANKIAVSTGGGSHYLKHTDNNSPEADQRKATLVYYLNPGWDAQSNGGQLRLYTRGGKQVDVPPEGDTLVLFLSDELEHEVLPNHDEREEHHRITYTLWLVQEGPEEQE